MQDAVEPAVLQADVPHQGGHRLPLPNVHLPIFQTLPAGGPGPNPARLLRLQRGAARQDHRRAPGAAGNLPGKQPAQPPGPAEKEINTAILPRPGAGLWRARDRLPSQGLPLPAAIANMEGSPAVQIGLQDPQDRGGIGFGLNLDQPPRKPGILQLRGAQQRRQAAQGGPRSRHQNLHHPPPGRRRLQGPLHLRKQPPGGGLILRCDIGLRDRERRAMRALKARPHRLEQTTPQSANQNPMPPPARPGPGRPEGRAPPTRPPQTHRRRSILGPKPAEDPRGKAPQPRAEAPPGIAKIEIELGPGPRRRRPARRSNPRPNLPGKPAEALHLLHGKRQGQGRLSLPASRPRRLPRPQPDAGLNRGIQQAGMRDIVLQGIAEALRNRQPRQDLLRAAVKDLDPSLAGPIGDAGRLEGGVNRLRSHLDPPNPPPQLGQAQRLGSGALQDRARPLAVNPLGPAAGGLAGENLKPRLPPAARRQGDAHLLRRLPHPERLPEGHVAQTNRSGRPGQPRRPRHRQPRQLEIGNRRQDLLPLHHVVPEKKLLAGERDREMPPPLERTLHIDQRMKQALAALKTGNLPDKTQRLLLGQAALGDLLIHQLQGLFHHNLAAPALTASSKRTRRPAN
ncbi:MAG: hypothetical protein M2R45_01127 [Verrucomicrobia subdivision 3 bacterium]|nr:hypothetical protein [Limisphaerales bacterium]MCS1417488.1 hypothetical protein [Limisphaerales bacterium]